MKNWVVFSSSSGQTFYEVWRALKKEAQSSFSGLFLDRPCEALTKAKDFLPENLIFDFSPKAPSDTLHFEEKYQKWLEARPNAPLVFLIGYFKIIRPPFFDLGFPLVNTHPSLLPAYKGMDKKVHSLAFENSLISGFSVHLVSEELDAGPLVFQKSTSIADCQSAQEVRDKVRALEQNYLPKVIEKLLSLDINAEDRKITTRELHNKKGFPLCVD